MKRNEARSSDLEELRSESIPVVSLALIMIGAFATLFLLPGPTYNLGGPFFISLSLFVEGICALLLCHREPVLARALLVLGPTLSLAHGLRVAMSPGLPYFAPLIVLANLVVNPWSGMVAAALNTLTLIVLLPYGAMLLSALALIWLTAGVEWLSLRSIYRALAWSEDSQQRASRLLEQLRSHQGELNRTVTALTEAARRLHRTNQQLAVARKEAE